MTNKIRVDELNSCLEPIIDAFVKKYRDVKLTHALQLELIDGIKSALEFGNYKQTRIRLIDEDNKKAVIIVAVDDPDKNGEYIITAISLNIDPALDTLKDM